MSDDNVHLLVPKKEAPVLNLALAGATDAELLSELERRGVDLSQCVFQMLAFTCAERTARWHANGDDFTVFERAGEMAGEAGEALNVAKKIRRHELKLRGNYKPGDTTLPELLSKLEYEIGDVFITAFNLANKCGLDPWRAMRTAFNTKSEEVGFPERL